MNLNIYLPDREAEVLRKMAEEQNRSVSNMVSTLIRNAEDVKVEQVTSADAK